MNEEDFYHHPNEIIFLIWDDQNPVIQAIQMPKTNNIVHFAFTSQDNAKEFLLEANKVGLAPNQVRVLPIALWEWFDGKFIQDINTHKITIDPDPEILHSPLFGEGFSEKHLNTPTVLHIDTLAAEPYLNYTGEKIKPQAPYM